MGPISWSGFRNSAFRMLLVSMLAQIPLLGWSQAIYTDGKGYRIPAYTAGVQAYHQGNYVQAVAALRTAVTQDITSTNAHYYLGLALDKLGFNADASREYQYVIHQGREAQIVNFAQERLTALASVVSDNETPQVIEVASINVPSRREGYVYPLQQIAVPLKNNQNALMVDAELTQQSKTTNGSFIIDTGATYTSISQEMAENLDLDLEHCEKVLITTANGRIEVPKIIIETLNVNGLEAHNVEATVIPVRHGSSFSGLLGLSFIRQFVVTIDPRAGHLIFVKN